ncbi:protein kinase [Auraticoccus sp. F435]|uniref:non-specific serine/threonine protein kinase n=1 Tax=Auraticoccus cholistanensis TaxID=2656650 RepID=A0A6A9UST6_9ACTN|nr:protein kinase [Auraticoccus cholistanensis]
MSEPGSLIAGRYRLLEMVGSGGMGVVWRAWDERLQREVAVKQLRPLAGLSDEETTLANDRAMREARITARLHHRHAVSVFDVVDDDGRPCLVMQFLASTTLAEVLRDHGPLPPGEVAHLGTRVASALAAAHDLGIIHRDVKPGNVLLGDDGSTLISDFGISRALDDISLTSTGMVHGTPAYLAPEVARGEEATYASDVFCLGATLYAALEGAPPFGNDANSIALLHRVASGSIQPPRQSGPLTPLLLRMLARDPAARPSMGTVAGELEALARTESGEAGRPSAGSTPPLPFATSAAAASVGTPADAPQQAVAGTSAAAPQPRPDTFRMDPAPPPRAAAHPAEDHRDAPEDTPPRRRRTGLAVLAVLVVVGALAALLVPQLLGDRGTVADPPVSSSSAEPSASDEPSADDTATASAPPPSSDEQGDDEQQEEESSSPAPSSAEPTDEDDGGGPSEQELREAITGYYALMPDRTDDAWPLMTSSYQSDHAGGREAYEDFWAEIERVEASDVTAEPPDRAQATLTYYYEDGGSETEVTAFELVEEEGVLKIAASSVLSSR